MMGNFLIREGVRIHLLYVVCVILVFLLLPSSSPSLWHTIFQIVFAFLSLCVLYLAFKKQLNEKEVFSLVFLNVLLVSILIRLLNVSIYGDYLGYNPIDSALYRSLASRFSTEDFHSLWSYLGTHGFAFDDYGYPTILTVVFYWFGEEVGLQAMLVINALIVAWGALLLYRILYRLLADQRLAKTGAIFWGIFPFSAYISAAGLKENIFVFFVILVFYSLDKGREKQWTLGLIFSVLVGLLGIGLNRLPIVYISILSMLSYRVGKLRFFRDNLLIISFIGLVFSYLFFDQIVGFAYAQKGYNDVDKILLATEEKMRDAGGMFLSKIFSYISVLVGPFPNLHAIDEDKASYITLYSLTGFLKCYLSFFFFYGCYYIIRNKVFSMFPFLVFFILHALMLVVSFYSLRERFQWPHMPIYVIISFWGAQQYKVHRGKKSYLFYYTLAITAMIAIFNLRIL